jgi:hypothetical protein
MAWRYRGTDALPIPGQECGRPTNESPSTLADIDILDAAPLLPLRNSIPVSQIRHPVTLHALVWNGMARFAQYL